MCYDSTNDDRQDLLSVFYRRMIMTLPVDLQCEGVALTHYLSLLLACLNV